MKALVSTFLPLCIFSFIAFGISVAVLGLDTGMTGSLKSETTIITEDFSDIEIISGGANITLYPADGDEAVVYASKKMLKSVHVEVRDGTLVVNCSRTIDDISDLFINLGSNDNTVEIAVPNDIYGIIEAEVSAGQTRILGLGAEVIDLQLNAGDLTYAAPEGYVTPSLNAKVNAGNCALYNAASEVFSLNLNAGNMDVYGLSGNGEFDTTAGNLTANFAKLDGDINVDTSAGNVDLNLPLDISAQVECDATAGEVSVKHGDTKENLDDGDTVLIGEGTYGIICDLTAGSVNITDSVKLKSAPAAPKMKPIDQGATVLEQPTVSSVGATDKSPVEVEFGDISVKVDENIKVDIGDAINVEIGG